MGPPDRGCEFDYEDTEISCAGGIFALNGKDGKIMWRRWLPKVVLSVHCDFEITGDRIPDCIATGKEGVSITIAKTYFNFSLRKIGTHT